MYLVWQNTISGKYYVINSSWHILIDGKLLDNHLKVNYNNDNFKNLYNVSIMFYEYPAKRGLVFIHPCNKKERFSWWVREFVKQKSWKNMLWHLLVFLILYPMSLLNPNSYLFLICYRRHTISITTFFVLEYQLLRYPEVFAISATFICCK